jgi:hypothetical protein
MMTKRKRRTDRNHIIYYIKDVVTNDLYIGITALSFNGNVKKTLTRRIQKHLQRARTENKNWNLSIALKTKSPENFVYGPIEVVRGKSQAHAKEIDLIHAYRPSLNTTGIC